MNTEIEIKPAGEADFATIQKIASATWADAFKEILSKEQIAYMLDLMYKTDALREQIEELDHNFLLALWHGEPLGFASYQINYNENKTKIHKIYVLPIAQGKGVGRKLIDRIKQKASDFQQSHIILNVNKYNRAIEFYKAYGFKKIGEENTSIGNGFVMEDAVMEYSM